MFGMVSQVILLVATLIHIGVGLKYIYILLECLENDLFSISDTDINMFW